MSVLFPAPSSPSVPSPLDRRFWFAYFLCALATLVPLWGVKYLPMVNLPQDAAEVSMWLHLSDPAWSVKDYAELHLFTPAFLGYLLATVIAKVTGPLGGVKVVITITTLGLPLVLLRILRRRGGDPWWALLGFPLSFGNLFFWGFFSYSISVPPALLFIDEADRYSRIPSLRGGVLLGGLMVVLFSHPLPLGLGAGLAALLVALRAPGGGAAARRLLPLIPPLLLMAGWVVWAAVHLPDFGVWKFDLGWHRLMLLPDFLFGPQPVDARLSFHQMDGLVFLLSLALLVALLLPHPRPSRDPVAWVPLGVVAAGFLLGPWQAMGGDHVYDRFAIFLLPLLLMALAAPPPSGLRTLGRGILVTAVVVWMGLLTVRFHHFDQEARTFDRVTASIGPGKRVAAKVYDPHSEEVPWIPEYGHFPSWLEARQDTVLLDVLPDRPLLFPVAPIPGREPPGFGLVDGDFAGREWYDFFLVRASTDVSPILFPPGTVPVKLVSREGEWWLFRNMGREGRREP